MFMVTPIKMNKDATTIGNTKHRIVHAHAFSLERFSRDLIVGSYAITCFKVVQYFDNAVEFSGVAKSMLEPAGLLVIGTQNRKRWVRPRQMDFHKTVYKSDCRPMHLTKWSRNTPEGRCLTFFGRSETLKGMRENRLIPQAFPHRLQLPRKLGKWALFAPYDVVFAYGRVFLRIILWIGPLSHRTDLVNRFYYTISHPVKTRGLQNTDMDFGFRQAFSWLMLGTLIGMVRQSAARRSVELVLGLIKGLLSA